MIEHISNGRMNDAVDGLLTASEMNEIDAHVLVCGACRDDYARVSETVAALRALPRSASVPDEAWAGLSGRLSATPSDNGAGEATVIELPTAVTASIERRVSFTVTQLAAAAIVLSVLSAGTMWVALGPTELPEATSAVSRNAPGGAAARAISTENTRYVEVVDQLEQILEQGRGVLAPSTLVTIEESLATVDAAIAEIETALGDDPNSDLLLRMLANHQRTKLGVLQRAAAAVQAQA